MSLKLFKEIYNNIYRVILVALGISLGLVSENALAEDVRIRTASSVQIEDREADNAAALKNKYREISVHYEDRTLDLSLRDNSEKLGPVAADLGAEAGIYAGHIPGIDGSWARLMQLDGIWSGVIFDGNELFLLDSSHTVADLLPTSFVLRRLATETMMYRAVDVVFSDTCGLSERSVHGSRWMDMLHELGDTEALLATRSVPIKVFAAVSYAQDVAGDPQAEIVNQLNVVQGIFDAQVGLEIDVVETTFLNTTVGLDSTSASVLLGQFRTFMGQQGNPRPWASIYWVQ